MDNLQTPSQAVRGARPDAETFDKVYLFKKVSILRATYQIRLLALHAGAAGKKLVLKVPPNCRFEASLDALVQAVPDVIHREDLP